MENIWTNFLANPSSSLSVRWKAYQPHRAVVRIKSGYILKVDNAGRGMYLILIFGECFPWSSNSRILSITDSIKLLRSFPDLCFSESPFWNSFCYGSMHSFIWWICEDHFHWQSFWMIFIIFPWVRAPGKNCMILFLCIIPLFSHTPE